MLPLFALLVPSASAFSWTDFADTIRRVEQMAWSSQVTAIAARHGLDVVNVTWEDTGRYHNSAVGPNISDMTIGVRDRSGALHPMPVFRFDNFVDTTADVRTDAFWLRVGNERGRSPRPITLAELLQNTRSYLHDSSSWSGWGSSLWASRDSHVLVSAQACFLPIPADGDATFTPVIYNYQSSPGNPAVLAIVATREGTSMQVVENDGGYLSQPLYFNEDGRRAPFRAERASDFAAHGGDASSPTWSTHPDDGLNVVLLVQVPLRYREPQRYSTWDAVGGVPMSAPAQESSVAKRSDVENAVVSHGPVEGPFREINGRAIERDPRFPVRVTVQFYKATSNGVVTDRDVADIRRQIDRVYADADYVGSLVVDGYPARPTAWTHPTPPPVSNTGTATRAEPFWNWLDPR